MDFENLEGAGSSMFFSRRLSMGDGDTFGGNQTVHQ